MRFQQCCCWCSAEDEYEAFKSLNTPCVHTTAHTEDTKTLLALAIRLVKAAGFSFSLRSAKAYSLQRASNKHEPLMGADDGETSE